MKTLIVLITFVLFSIVYAQPIILKSVTSDYIEFYIITVNGDELEEDVPVRGEFGNYHLLKNLQELNLKNGTHEILLRTGNEEDESEDIMFFIKVKNSKKHISYTIIPDPNNDDPNYLLKFDYDNLEVRVKKPKSPRNPRILKKPIK